jgi:hypothetical protein
VPLPAVTRVVSQICADLLEGRALSATAHFCTSGFLLFSIRSAHHFGSRTILNVSDSTGTLADGGNRYSILTALAVEGLHPRTSTEQRALLLRRAGTKASLSVISSNRKLKQFTPQMTKHMTASLQDLTAACIAPSPSPQVIDAELMR